MHAVSVLLCARAYPCNPHFCEHAPFLGRVGLSRCVTWERPANRGGYGGETCGERRLYAKARACVAKNVAINQAKRREIRGIEGQIQPALGSKEVVANKQLREKWMFSPIELGVRSVLTLVF